MEFQNPSENVSPGHTVSPATSESEPSADWSLEQLAEYATSKLSVSDKIEGEISVLTRRSVEAYFHAGYALSVARRKLKATRKWERWLTNMGFAKTSAHEAIALFVKAKSVAALTGLSLTEAKIKYGVITPRTPKPTVKAKPAAVATSAPTALPDSSARDVSEIPAPKASEEANSLPVGDPVAVLDRIIRQLEAVKDMTINDIQRQAVLQRLEMISTAVAELLSAENVRTPNVPGVDSTVGYVLPTDRRSRHSDEPKK